MDLTYPDVGGTRDWPLPRGYHHMRRRARLGKGQQAYAAAVEGLKSFEMQRRAGLVVRGSGSVGEGAEVRLGAGVGPLRLWAPCRVVWAFEEARRYGYGYGTLPGHPERGEEGFLLWQEPDGTVWFEIRTFSVAGRWYTMLAGPMSRLAQDYAANRYIKALRAIATQRPAATRR